VQADGAPEQVRDAHLASCVLRARTTATDQINKTQ
jgi:hypothetical protein